MNTWEFLLHQQPALQALLLTVSKFTKKPKQLHSWHPCTRSFEKLGSESNMQVVVK